MTRRTVDRNLLRSTTDDIGEFARQVFTFINDIEDDVAEHCAKVWSSEAQEEYQNRHRDWRTLMEGIHTDFCDLQTIAENALHNYGHATATNVEMLRRK